MSAKTEEKIVRQRVVLYLVVSYPRRGDDPGRDEEGDEEGRKAWK